MPVFVKNHSDGDSVVLDVKLTCRIVTRMVHTGVQHTQNYSMGDNNNNSKEGGRGCSSMVEWRQCGKLQIYCFCKGLNAGIFCPANFSLMMRNNKKSHELDKAKSGLWSGWTRTWMHFSFRKVTVDSLSPSAKSSVWNTVGSIYICQISMGFDAIVSQFHPCEQNKMKLLSFGIHLKKSKFDDITFLMMSIECCAF